jgi:GGDEF domain-containing protein
MPKSKSASTSKADKTVTVKMIRNRMIVFYSVAVIIFFLAAFIYVFTTLKKLNNSEILKQIGNLNVQLMTSVNHFTESVESDCSEIYENEDVISYDPIVNDYADYEQSSLKTQVKNELLVLSTGSSYSDYFILFSDNTSVGKTSSGTIDTITQKGYEGFNEKLDGENNVWYFGMTEKYRKIYYIQRVTDHSLLVVSRYLDSLQSVFNMDAGETNDVFIVADKDERVICSSTEEISSGDQIPQKYAKYFDYKNGDSFIGSTYIGASLTTDCDWQVISITKSPSLIEISPLSTAACITIAIVIILFCIIVGVIACSKYMVSDLANPELEFIDPITGTLNEYGLDEKISELIETSLVGSTYAFILIGIKDSDAIKATVSNRCWNNVRMKLIKSAEKFFSDRNCLTGRVSEDNIAVFADFSEFNLFKAHEKLKLSCEEFCCSFEDLTIGTENDVILHVSIGACIYPDHAEDFDSLLELAAKALDKAEQSNENSFEIYKPETKEAAKN